MRSPTHGRHWRSPSWLFPSLPLLGFTGIFNLCLWVIFGDRYHAGVLLFTLCLAVPAAASLVNARGRIYLAVLAGLGGAVVGFLLLSHTSAWCCMTVSDRRSLCQLFFEVEEIFHRHAIDHHVTWGSLIGAIRENNDQNSAINGLIPWEHDVDMAVHVRHLQTANDLLQKKGFQVEQSAGEVRLRVKHTNISSLSTIWKMLWIDIYGFALGSDGFVTGSDPTFKDIPNRFVYPYTSVSMCSRKDVPGPHYPHAYLATYYNEDFMTKRLYPSSYKKVFCFIYQDC